MIFSFHSCRIFKIELFSHQSDSEVDPLDAFMNDIKKDLKKDTQKEKGAVRVVTIKPAGKKTFWFKFSSN